MSERIPAEDGYEEPNHRLADYSVSVCLQRTYTNRQIPEVASTDGSVYRLDKSSGEVWLIRGDKMDKIREYDFLLRVGNRYICEDFYSFVYLGKGEVGDIKASGPIKVDPSKLKKGWN